MVQSNYMSFLVQLLAFFGVNNCLSFSFILFSLNIWLSNFPPFHSSVKYLSMQFSDWSSPPDNSPSLFCLPWSHVFLHSEICCSIWTQLLSLVAAQPYPDIAFALVLHLFFVVLTPHHVCLFLDLLRWLWWCTSSNSFLRDSTADIN